MHWVILCVLQAAAPPPAGAPVYVGLATRGPGLEAAAERTAVAIGRALEAKGVADMGSPPLPAGPETADATLDALVATARARYLEGDFAASVAKAGEAVDRFEGAGAYRPGPAWSSYGDALVVKALGLRRMNKEGEADAAWRKLASTMPRAVPDPGITPPKIAQRFQTILAETKAKPPVQIEIVTVPPGAEVVIDGTTYGAAPVVVKDLFPGVHFVGLAAEGERVERQVTVTSGSAKVEERVGDVRSGTARALRELLAAPVPAATLFERARGVGDDVFAGALVPNGGQTLLVLARVTGGRLFAVGTRVDTQSAAKDRATALVDALLAGRVGWLAGDGPGTSPEGVLTQGVGSGVAGLAPLTPDAPAADDDSSLILIGVGAGVAVAAVAATVAGVVVGIAAANQLEVTVDASQL